MIITKTVKVKWHNANKNWYMSKGYEFTKIKDEFEVNVDDLSKGCHEKIEVECDNCTKILFVEWHVYFKCKKNNNIYYCNKCAFELNGKHKMMKTKLKNTISFEEWCLNNNRKDLLDRWDYKLNSVSPKDIPFSTCKSYYFKCDRLLHKSEQRKIGNITQRNTEIQCISCRSFKQWCLDNDKNEWLDLWDYKLNEVAPSEIYYGTTDKYYFKCPKGIHKSELKSINVITSKKNTTLSCNTCNSFACVLVNKYDKVSLEQYWDYDKNTVDPYKLSYSSRQKIWIKCINNSYHGSYLIGAGEFIKGCRCAFCSNRNGRVHRLDSLGFLYPSSVSNWSDKNNKQAYDYAPWSTQVVWWKCQNGKHKDYARSINTSMRCSFECPDCSSSKGENMIIETLNKYNISYKYQKTYKKLFGLGGGRLSYDFYLAKHNLLIEYQGKQHNKAIDFSGNGNEYAVKQFIQQQEHDRRKKQYAEDHNIKLLEIWYWDFDNIEEILKKELKL